MYNISDNDELEIYITNGWQEYYIPKFRLYMIVDEPICYLYWTDTEKGASGITRELALDFNDVTFGYTAPSSASEIALVIWQYQISAFGGGGGGGTPADASNTIKGITKLSVAPASPTDPIAVGDNDARNSNARTPTAHAASHTNGTDDIQNATTSQKGLLTSTDWNTFNNKQAALGFTPENVANKQTDLTASATNYPTIDAVNTGLAAKLDNSAGAAGLLINSASAATPNNGDFVATAENSGFLRKITWTNVKAFLKTYFDTLYQVILVSGTNIKTINGSSVLGSGDLVVSGADPAGWTTIVKSADQDVTNAAASVTADSELNFAVVNGESYMVEMILTVSGSNATGDYACLFYSASAGVFDGYGTSQGLTAALAVQNLLVSATSSTVTNTIVTGTPANIGHPIALRITFSFRSFYDGTFYYFFGNSAAAAGRTSRTWKGSIMRYKQLN